MNTTYGFGAQINLWQPIVQCTMYIHVHLREFSKKIIGNV
jgi:hypothetical protein